MSSSNCCFLTCIQVSQEAGQVVWYSHLFQNFPQFIVIHTVKSFAIVNKAEVDVFSGTLLLFWWSSVCWQIGLWFLSFLKPAWTSLRTPGEGVNLTGWPRVLRSPSRHEVVFYGTICLGWLDPLVPTGGGLHDPLEKAAVPKQPDGTDACWGTTASMTLGDTGNHTSSHWGPSTGTRFQKLFVEKLF